MKHPKLQARIAELEKKLFVSEASQVHNHHFADMSLGKAANCMGSGVILTITKLDGRNLVDPVLIRNGLSDASVAALRADLARSFQYATELKPKGAV